MTSKSVMTMENNPSKSEYKLMVKLLGLYENSPQDLLPYEEKPDYLYTFARIFPKSWQEANLDLTKREQERIQLTFDKVKYPNWKDLKEHLKPNRVCIVFGRLNQVINPKTGGRSFSVYRLALMPENIIEIKDEKTKQGINIKVN